MRTTSRACLLGLALLAAPLAAHGNGLLPPVKIDTGIKAWFNVYRLDQYGNPVGTRTAPWYLYYPYNAHFAAPVPVGGQYPNWPAGAAAVTGVPGNLQTQPQGGAGGSADPVERMGFRPGSAPVIQNPFGYGPSGSYGPAPSYWYGQ